MVVKEEMEEEEDSSEVSSPPLLPIRPTPTSFFQPFLPRPPNSSQENNNVIKPLTFSIDNILRPTFGGRGSGADGHPLHSIFSSPFLNSLHPLCLLLSSPLLSCLPFLFETKKWKSVLLGPNMFSFLCKEDQPPANKKTKCSAEHSRHRTFERLIGINSS